MADVEIEKILAFEEALHGYLTSEKGELEDQINSTGDWNDDIEAQFVELVEDFKKTQTF
jgi:F-type H+-transporting ATPase subunit alpha